MTIKENLVEYINNLYKRKKFFSSGDIAEIVFYVEDTFKIIFPDKPIFDILKNNIPPDIKNKNHKYRYYFILKTLQKHLFPILPRYGIRNYQCKYYTCLCEPSPCSCELSLELEAKAEIEIKTKKAEEIRFQELLAKFKKANKEHKKHKHLGNLNKIPKQINLDSLLSL